MQANFLTTLSLNRYYARRSDQFIILVATFVGCVIHLFLPSTKHYRPQYPASIVLGSPNASFRIFFFLFFFSQYTVEREACTLHGTPTNNGDPVARHHRQRQYSVIANTTGKKPFSVLRRTVPSFLSFDHLCTDNLYPLLVRKQIDCHIPRRTARNVKVAIGITTAYNFASVDVTT